VKQHNDWVKAQIQGIPALAAKTFVLNARKDGTGSFPPAPFVIIYPVDGVDTVERLAGPSSTQNPRFILHIIGSSYDNVAAVTALVKPLFVQDGIGVTPVILGESCGRVWWRSPQPVALDRDVTPPIPFQVIELGFTADPA